MNVAVVNTGPGVTCPIATASSSCCSVIQPSRSTKSPLEEGQQHVAAAVQHRADLQHRQRTAAPSWPPVGSWNTGSSGSTSACASGRADRVGGAGDERPAEQHEQLVDARAGTPPGAAATRTPSHTVLTTVRSSPTSAHATIATTAGHDAVQHAFAADGVSPYST